MVTHVLILVAVAAGASPPWRTGPTCWNAERGQQAAATVNGRVIPRDAFERRVRAGRDRDAPDPPSVLAAMVREVLVEDEALRRGIPFPAAELEAYVASLRERGGFLRVAELEGRTLQDFRAAECHHLLRERLAVEIGGATADRGTAWSLAWQAMTFQAAISYEMDFGEGPLPPPLGLADGPGSTRRYPDTQPISLFRGRRGPLEHCALSDPAIPGPTFPQPVRVVMARRVPLLEEPHYASRPHGTLAAGSRVVLCEQRRGWSRVTVVRGGAGIAGYVPTAVLSREPAQAR